MSLRVFDFECPHGHVVERFVDAECRVVTCGHNGCTEYAQRLIPAVRSQLDGCSGDFPSAADAWERRRESHMRKERKSMENHGEYQPGWKSTDE